MVRSPVVICSLKLAKTVPEAISFQFCHVNDALKDWSFFPILYATTLPDTTARDDGGEKSLVFTFYARAF